MGRLQLDCLGGQDKIYHCGGCATYLTNSENLLSRNFRSGTGEAFLFKQVVNVRQSELSDKDLTTGRHWVRDIGCKVCHRKLGWMYEMAIPDRERYKESCTVLECALIDEISGIKRDPNFEPLPRPSTAGTPTNGSTTSLSRLGTGQASYPAFVNYSAFYSGNLQNLNDISELARLINGFNAPFSAQAFVDATAAVASASIARRSSVRMSLMRGISNNLNTNAASSTSSFQTPEIQSNFSARSRHFAPSTNASTQMARRSLQNMALSTIFSSIPSPSGHFETRQPVITQRQSPAYSRGSTSSRGSATSTTFSSLPDNLSEASSSGSSSNFMTTASSSSASTSSSIRNFSINMNPSHSVEDSDEDVRELRSGRRISRISGNR